MKWVLALLMVVSAVPVLPARASTSSFIISPVTPLQAVYNVPQTYWATASGSPAGVSSCSLLISSTYTVPMTYIIARSRWEASYTFTTPRSANSIRAVCTNELGNTLKGPSKIISVTEAPVTTGEGTSEVDATGQSATQLTEASPVLIKTACPGGEDISHPCRTVYFLDQYGTRHAFPNEKVYFSWYANWNGIYVINSTVMASINLGPNVVYRPGFQLVKFPSLNTVYAVSRWGVLRPIASEAVAGELYGIASWNTERTDDISEVFYFNYTIGESIDEASDFDVDVELVSVASINDNLSDIGGWVE